MTPDFDPGQISSDEYRNRIGILEARLVAQREALAKTERELAWWREGLALFGSGDATPNVETDVPSNGTKPVLREALLRIMREGRATGKHSWKPPELIDVLTQRGWMPNGDNAAHIVRSRLADLVKNEELERPGYGRYALPDFGDPDSGRLMR